MFLLYSVNNAQRPTSAFCCYTYSKENLNHIIHVKLQTNFESIVLGFEITEALSTLCAPLGNSN